MTLSDPPKLLTAPFPAGAEDLAAGWLPAALGLVPGPRHRTEVARVGEGRGHMGSAFRVRFLSDEPDHPARSFVVKLPALEGPARQTAERGGLYDREVRFFLEVAHRSPVRAPRCYAAGYEEGRGFALVLEDLGEAAEIDQVTGIDPVRSGGILDQLADFHATWWGAEALDTMSWATRHTDEHRVTNLTHILEEGWPRLTAELHDRLPQGCHESGADMAEILPEAFRALSHEPHTLLHGDVRLDNLLFDGADGPASILDWQSISRGPAAIDVAYFLAQNLTPADLATHGDGLLRDYQRRLADSGIDYPWLQLRRAVSLAMPLTFAVASSLFFLADAGEERTRDLAAAMAGRALAAVKLFGHPRDILVGV